jgi:ribosomal protein S18 acetylase RimI-like enzyme
MWRVARPADDAAIIELSQKLYTEDPSTLQVSRAQTQRSLTTLRENPTRGRAIVLDLEGELRGFALLISFWSNELGGVVCYIDELYVETGHRGRGYARAMVESLAREEALWPRKDLVALALEVTPANHQARRLYESLGFEVAKNTPLRRLLKG